MQKFEAAKLFLKVLTEHPDDFTIKQDGDGRSTYYYIQHTQTGTRVNMSVSGKVESYVADAEHDLNFVDSETANQLAEIARDTLEKQRELARIAKDNKLVYNITAIYA